MSRSKSEFPRCELIVPNASCLATLLRVTDSRSGDLHSKVHVHVLFKVGTVPMSEIVGACKKHTGRLANKLRGKQGAFWAEDYFDVFMRDGQHERQTVHYIENNPTKAKLVLDPKDWPWTRCAVSG